MSDTTSNPQTTDTQDHPADGLIAALVEIANRIPWHSDVQLENVLDHLRSSEAALKADLTNPTTVVPPAPARPEPASPVAAVAAGAGIDYDKLASAIVAAQAQQAADAQKQMAQANEAVAADPGFVTPGVTPPEGETHAVTETLPAEPAQPVQ